MAEVSLIGDTKYFSCVNAMFLKGIFCLLRQTSGKNAKTRT